MEGFFAWLVHYQLGRSAKQKKNGRIGLRAVVRDHLGVVHAAYGVTREGLFEPTAVEAVAVMFAI